MNNYFYDDAEIRYTADVALMEGATLAEIARSLTLDPDKVIAELRARDGDPPKLASLTWRAAEIAAKRERSLRQLRAGKANDLNEWSKLISDACKAGASRDDVRKAIQRQPVSRAEALRLPLNNAPAHAAAFRRVALDALKSAWDSHTRQRVSQVPGEAKQARIRLDEVNKAMASEERELDGVDKLLEQADWVIRQTASRKALERAAVATAGLPDHIRKNVDRELERGLTGLMDSSPGDAATALAQAERTIRQAGGALAEMRPEQREAKRLLEALETEAAWLSEREGRRIL